MPGLCSDSIELSSDTFREHLNENGLQNHKLPRCKCAWMGEVLKAMQRQADRRTNNALVWP